MERKTPDYMRVCSRCKVSKNLSEFAKNRSVVGGYHYYCRECQRIKSQEWRDRNPDASRLSRKNYVDRIKAANRLLEAQELGVDVRTLMDMKAEEVKETGHDGAKLVRIR